LIQFKNGGAHTLRHAHRAARQGNPPSLRHAARVAKRLNAMTVAPPDRRCLKASLFDRPGRHDASLQADRPVNNKRLI
jgi:hypothetical protein